MDDRQELSSLLAEEAKLMEIVQLMGSDVLPDDQKLIIEIARVHPCRLSPAERLP